MINILLDIALFAFLVKKRTPARFVVVLSVAVLVILVLTVIKQADYVR